MKEGVSLDNFIRAFWRRIDKYKNDYGAELPDVMPVEFESSMQTAFLALGGDNPNKIESNQPTESTNIMPTENNQKADEFQLYQCHKQVHSKPMNLGDYNEYRGWAMPANEDPQKAGYLVIYNRGTEKHHESWSPKDIFDEGYKLIESAFKQAFGNSH